MIPPFCPASSIVYEQFGHKEARALRVSGFTITVWDDCLSRFSLDQGMVTSAVLHAGSRIVVMANVKNAGSIILYDAATFEELRRLKHPERVLDIGVSKLGDKLVSYGYQTTRVWKAASGKCLKVVRNPPKRPRPRTLALSEDSKATFFGSEDRRIWKLRLDDDAAPEWKLYSSIEEESLDGTAVRFPVCSALSPDGTVIAYGYRAHPVTVWELEPQMLLGQCHLLLDDADKTVQESTCGEVFKLAWHPFAGEVFGLTLVGLLFRGNPCEAYAGVRVHTGANSLAVSRDGSLVATGDGIRTLKLFHSADLTLLYQLSTQDPVLYVSFSSDSRRLYDIRESYGNVWEPNTLVRLAERSEYPENSSDTSSKTESLARVSQHTENYVPPVDSIITLPGQSVGPLYSYGTEGGVAAVCEVGKGKVRDLERQQGFMSIEQMAWSEDGRYVAFSDLSGKLFVKGVSRSGEKGKEWDVDEEFRLIIPSHLGHIKNLLFHPSGRMILAATSFSLNTVDISGRQLELSVPFEPISAVEWICHPASPAHLLGLGDTNIQVFAWGSLRHVATYAYILPPPTHVPADYALDAEQHVVGKVISHTDSPYIILRVSSPATSEQVESRYVLFQAADIQPDPDMDHSAQLPEKEVPCSTLPYEIASRIHEPLALMSRRRLVFLDVDRWLCTWALPLRQQTNPSSVYLAAGVGGGVSGQINGAIERYYFLPGDWVAAHESQLCRVTPDGTFLCPRNRDVVAVQCSRLKK